MRKNRSSINREIFKGGLISFVFAVLVFGLFLIKPDFDSAISDAKKSVTNENNHINEYMGRFFRETDTLLTSLTSEKDVIEAVNSEKQDSVLKLYKTMTDADENIAYVYSGYQDGTMIINNYELPDDFDPRERPWYKTASREKDKNIRTSYKDINSGKWLFSNSKAILGVDGETVGVMAIDISIQKILDILDISDNYSTQTSFLIDDKNNIIVHSEKKFFGQKLEDVAENLGVVELDKIEGELDYEMEGEDIWAHYKKIEGTNFYSVTAISKSEVLDPLYNRTIVLAFGVVLGVLAIGAFQNKMLKNRFIEPFMELGDRIKAIAEEKEQDNAYYSFRSSELVDIANDIETIAKKSIEDRARLLRYSEDKYKKLIENLSKDYFIYILDKHGELEYVSPSVEDMLGYSPEEFIEMGKSFEFKNICFLDGLDKERENSDSTTYETEFQNSNKDKRTIEITEILLRDEEGTVVGVEGIAKDMTEIKERQKKIEYLSFYDSMTGLYNRRFFEEELKRLDAERNYPLTLLYADINGLKLANDVFGHSTGDKLIVKVAENIKKGCRKDDIVARIGGDEFAIILPSTGEKEIRVIVDRIKAEIDREKIGQVVVSSSFGWATKKAVGEPMEDILKKADEFMYKKKLSESPEMRKKTVERIIQKSKELGIVKEELKPKELDLISRIGSELELREEEFKALKDSYRFRNIGKIALEKEVLKKTGKLTDEEWKSIKRHPELGYRILSASPDYIEISQYILSHHEKWDGSGYPKGVSGDEIPKISRIIALIEAYMAMLEEKPYRRSLNQSEIIDEFKQKSGAQFDPDILEVFLKTTGQGS